MKISLGLTRNTTALLLLIATAIVGYCIAWIRGYGAGLSLTGYDLAEWVSLIPGVRYGENPMLTPGLLRVQLMLMAMLVALVPARRWSVIWWICAGAALAFTVAQLPPFEYFIRSDWRDDVNYGQQATLSLLMLINVAICLFVPRIRASQIAMMLVAIIGIITAVGGISQAFDLAQNLQVPLTIGAGSIIYCAAMVGVFVISLRAFRR